MLKEREEGWCSVYLVFYPGNFDKIQYHKYLSPLETEPACWTVPALASCLIPKSGLSWSQERSQGCCTWNRSPVTRCLGLHHYRINSMITPYGGHCYIYYSILCRVYPVLGILPNIPMSMKRRRLYNKDCNSWPAKITPAYPFYDQTGDNHGLGSPKDTEYRVQSPERTKHTHWPCRLAGRKGAPTKPRQDLPVFRDISSSWTSLLGRLVGSCSPASICTT